MRSGSWGVLCALVFFGSSAAADPEARGRSHALSPQRGAQQPTGAPRIEVLVIEASAGDGGVASALAGIPQLRQPPLSSFSQMRLLSRNTVALAQSPSSAALPGGRSASITLASRSPGNRFTVNVSFSTGGSIQFVAGVGEPFFTVRASRPGRGLIIGFIVRS